jgi:hypothetical protein
MLHSIAAIKLLKNEYNAFKTLLKPGKIMSSYCLQQPVHASLSHSEILRFYKGLQLNVNAKKITFVAQVYNFKVGRNIQEIDFNSQIFYQDVFADDEE